MDTQKLNELLLTVMTRVSNGEITLAQSGALNSLAYNINNRYSIGNKLIKAGQNLSDFACVFENSKGKLTPECISIFQDADIKQAKELSKKIRQQNNEIKEHLKTL